eukprot:g758.t1
MGSSTTASPAHQRGDLLLLEDTSHGGASPLGLMSVGDHSDYIDHPRHVVGAHHLPHLRAGGLMAGQEQHYQLFQQNNNHFLTPEDVPDSAAALGGAGIPSRSSSVRGLVVPGGRISSHAGAGLFRAASSSSSISASLPDHHGSEDRDRAEREHAEHLQQFSAGGTPVVPVDTNTTSATTAAQSGASSALQHQPQQYQSTVDRLIGQHSHNAAALEGSATPFYREPPALDPKMLQPLHQPQVSIVADATDYQNPATALDDVYRGWGHMGYEDRLLN